MTFRQLQYFLEVARTLNFSKAAEALFVSQSTLSKAIATLEEELGAVLFIRDHHNVSLTPAGAVLATNLPRLRDDLNKTIDLVQEVKEGMRGRLAIGVRTGFALPEIITSAVEYCRSSMPFLSISISSMDEAELMRSLANGRMDFALSYRLEEDARMMDAQQGVTILESSPVVLCTAKGSSVSEAPTCRELSRLRYAFSEPDSSPLVQRWAEYCRNNGFHPTLMQVKDTETAYLHAEMDLAVMVAPLSQAQAHAMNVRTAPIPDAYAIASVMVSNPDNLNQIVEVFTKLIEADL